MTLFKCQLSEFQKHASPAANQKLTGAGPTANEIKSKPSELLFVSLTQVTISLPKHTTPDHTAQLPIPTKKNRSLLVELYGFTAFALKFPAYFYCTSQKQLAAFQDHTAFCNDAVVL